MDNNKPNDTAQADVAEQEATNDTASTDVETSTEGEAESSSSQNDFDIDAAIEAEKKRVPDPDKAKEAFKKREEKRLQQEQGGTSDDDTTDDDKPLTRKDLDEIQARVRQQVTNEVRAEQISEIVSTFADSEKERELIIAIHSNRVFPADMPLKEQLIEAHFIANGKRLAAKNQEVVRALKSKDTTNKDTASVQRDGTQAPAPKLAADVAASLKRAGYSYDASLKVYKKPLSQGRFMYNDPRTKRTWVK